MTVKINKNFFIKLSKVTSKILGKDRSFTTKYYERIVNKKIKRIKKILHVPFKEELFCQVCCPKCKRLILYLRGIEQIVGTEYFIKRIKNTFLFYYKDCESQIE